MAPVLLQPQCSSSAVVAAEFHPQRENYFVIGFEDGSAAVYDAYYFYNSHGGKRRENAVTLGNNGEKAFIKGLHIGTMTKNATVEGSPVTDQGGIGPKESGISAVAFVPERKATVVTVGADGKCCVVDFTQPTKHKAILLKSWHIRRPATSLSIICSAEQALIGHFDGPDDAKSDQRHELPSEMYYIAVGSSEGKVLLFDLDGKALGEQTLDDKSAQIIDVEWTEIRSASALPHPHQNIGSGIRRSPVVKRKRKSLGSSALAETRPLQMGLVAVSSNVAERSEDSLFDFTTPHRTLGPFHWEPPSDESTVAAMNLQDGVTERTSIIEADGNEYQRQTHINTNNSGAILHKEATKSSLQTETEASSSFHSATENGSTPPIPPRPIPKPGGRLSMRRAQTSGQPDYQSTTYQSTTAKARRVSASNPRLSKALPVVNPPTKTKVLFGSRRPSGSRTDHTRANVGHSKLHTESEKPEDAWLDVPPETPRRGKDISPVSSATSSKSYKTAVSHPYTSDSPERSDDTVVDWTVGLPRQPVPTLQITHPSGERPSKGGSKKKGHVSLSVSSESAGTLTPTPSVSDTPFRPLSRSTVGSPPKALPSLPPTPSTGPRTGRLADSKQKGHVSLPVSPTSSNETITPLSSDSNGPIIQWPSLKKSPRIPDLNKGLPDPNKYASPPASFVDASSTDSATDTILEGYATLPPPSPPKAAKTPWLASTVYPEREAPPRPPPEAVAKPVLGPNVDLGRESQPIHCNCGLSVKSMLEASFEALRAEIAQQFHAQRIWFEELLRAEEEDRVMLAEQNRGLRGELAGIEKGKEKEGGGSGKSD